jgi:flagellar biosynthesis/type III secretory pathway protein FliH
MNTFSAAVYDADTDTSAISPYRPPVAEPQARPEDFSQARLDALRTAAHDEGFTTGYAEGHDRARAEWETLFTTAREEGRIAGETAADEAMSSRLADFEQRSRSAVAALVAAAERLDTADRLVLDELTDTIAVLAAAAAAAVVGTAVDTEPAQVALHRAAEAARLAPSRGDLIIRLNPADLEALPGSVELPGRTIILAADPEVTRGGAVAEVGPAQIDAQVPAALERVLAVLHRNDHTL